MALWKPDQTFYPSPRMAMQAPRERLAYVVAFDPGARTASMTRCACSTSIPSRQPTASRRPRRNAQCRRRAASFRLERVQRRAVPVRAASTRRAALPDRAGPEIVANLHLRYEAGPAKAAAGQNHRAGGDRVQTGYSRPHTIHCGPDAIYVSASALPMATARAGSFSSITRASTCSADGKSIAGRSNSPTISGGILVGTSPSPANGARPI